MTDKYVGQRRSDKKNQIAVRNGRVFNNRNKGINTKLFLSVAFSILFAFALISLSSGSVVATSELEDEGAEFNIQELYSSRNSGRVLHDQNIATAAGVGRIMENTAQGRLLGKRAALTDARRNLLILRRKLLQERGEDAGSTNNVSGRIAGVRIHSERVRDNLYFLQVDIPLDELMEGEFEIDG